MPRARAYAAAILILTLTLGTAVPATAATSADVIAHRAAAAEARRKAAAALALAEKLKVETAQLDDKVASLQAETDKLDPQIANANTRTQRITADLESLRAQIASKTAAIEDTKARYANEQQLLSQRVSATYRQGEWFYFELLLGSGNIRDFVTRTELVSRVIRSNNDAAVNLAATKAELDRAKAELDRALEETNVKRREAQMVALGLKKLQVTRQSKVNEQQSVLDQKSQLMAENKKNAARLLAFAKSEEEESSRIAAMLAKHRGSGQYKGVMAWPAPGFFNVTSPFGWRIHPIFKTRRLHTGIDIGKNSPDMQIYGAAIVAAGEGDVIWAGARGGYGNVVMIDHGNGVVSLYAHQQAGGIRVAVGQHVRKGDRIGTVGSTGYSTGPHLHFEVRINGDPVDPMNYLR